MKNKAANLDTMATAPESVTVAVAARRLGLSVRSVKRLFEAGRLPHFRTDGGHLRVLKVDLEGFIQSLRNRASSSPPVQTPAPVSAPLQQRRERIDALRLDAEELRAKRELQKLQDEQADEERAKARDLRTRVLTQRRLLEEADLERTRDEDARRRRQEEHDRNEFVQKWRRWMFLRIPDWLSHEQRQQFEHDVHAAILQCDASQTDNEITEFLQVAIQRVLWPWFADREEMDRRNKLIDQKLLALPQGASESEKLQAKSAARVALSALPIGADAWDAIDKAIDPIKRRIADRQVLARRDQMIQRAGDWSTLGFSATPEDQAEATAAVRAVFSTIAFDVGEPEERRMMEGAIAPIRRRIEERWSTEQKRIRNEREKSSLVTFAMFKIPDYIDESGIDLEYSEKTELENVIKRRLAEEITGEESQDEVNGIARDIADEELDKFELD